MPLDKLLHLTVGFGLAMTLRLVTTPSWTVTAGLAIATAREVGWPNHNLTESLRDAACTMGGVSLGILTNSLLSRDPAKPVR